VGQNLRWYGQGSSKGESNGKDAHGKLHLG
jgi:hypothetical protein